MKPFHFFLSGFVSVLYSCSLNDITLPPVNPDTNLINTVSLSEAKMKKMEGIYKLSGCQDDLGTRFVCRVSKYKVSFFSDKSGILFVLKYGFNPVDGYLQFSGFWRFSENTNQGLINFSVQPGNGSLDLVVNGIATNLKMQGVFKDGNGIQKDIFLAFERPFTDYAKNNEFIVFGHHGIQTTANPPYAENSLKAAFHAQEYGMTGIEFDVRLTKDNVPICVHDATVNIRLTEKSPISGYYDQYGFTFLQNFLNLKDGQKIPSVEEVLNVVIDSTNLKYVWLDIKGNKGVFNYVGPVVQKAYARAAALNRSVTVFSGLPTTEMVEEFQATPSYTYPTLCELSVQDAIDNKSIFFGPRYSMGLLLDDVDRAHSMGIRVISWTLNDKNIIYNYLQNGRFDGFITDYPAYVVYDFYTMY